MTQVTKFLQKYQKSGVINKLKLIGIKGGKNVKKLISSWSFTHRRERREGVERESLTSL